MGFAGTAASLGTSRFIPDMSPFTQELIEDFKRDAERYDKRANRLEIEVQELRRKAMRARFAIEYAAKKSAAVEQLTDKTGG